MTPEKMRALQAKVDELKHQNKLLKESMVIKIDRIDAGDKALKRAKAKIKNLEG